MTPPWQHALSGQRFYISRSNRRRGIQPVLNHTIDNDTNLTASSTLFGKIFLTVPNYDDGEVWFFCAHISPLAASSIQKKNLIFILVAERYTKTGMLHIIFGLCFCEILGCGQWTRCQLSWASVWDYDRGWLWPDGQFSTGGGGGKCARCWIVCLDVAYKTTFAFCILHFCNLWTRWLTSKHKLFV